MMRILSVLLSTSLLFSAACAEKAVTADKASEPASAAAETVNAAIRDVAPEAAAALLAADAGVKVLDIRTPEEFAVGHIAGALNINFYDADFEEQLAALDKNAAYVLHCRSGGRSGRSLKSFKKLGFTNVSHLTAGFNGWRAAALPIASDDNAQ
ncbi:MAG: rhodanese-like domain-containing protein [Pseudomonadota bacterium]